jgi:hypothetical protein
MTNKKKWMLERLSRLVKLCKSTEPDKPDDSSLFTLHNIDAHSMYSKVDHEYNVLDAEETVDIMKSANRIWRIRRKIWNGEFDVDWAAEMQDGIEDLVETGAIIQAIKYYRSMMKQHTGDEPGLKASKDFVDAIRDDMRKKGILK